MYYGGTKPHSDRERSFIETFNEGMTMLMVYHMVCFSDFN
jgi:magnesium-transporting ATPase (P-type)